MREIHDFDAVKKWRWQIAFQSRDYVYSKLPGHDRILRKWRHTPYPAESRMSCNSLGSLISGADYSESIQRPNFATIRMVERGALLVLVERRRLLRFEAGEICLLPPYRDYAEAPDGAECLHHYMTVAGTLLPEVLHSFGLTEVCGIRPASPKDFKYLLEKGFSLPCGDSVMDRAANAGFCLEMLQTLASWRAADPMPPELAAMTGFIDGHLAEPISLERLAESAGCTVTRLYRLCREVFGSTPHRHVVERRMEFARRSLQKGVPVKEIAQSCGYRNPFNFSVEFKKFHGVSPQSFRASSK